MSRFTQGLLVRGVAVAVAGTVFLGGEAARPAATPGASALTVVNGKEQFVDGGEAVRGGATLIDLSDDWTPYLFTEARDAAQNPLFNRYRTVFLGLADDAGDRDGQPLAKNEHNYLELYGVPPTLSVLRARFLDDTARSCANVDFELLRATRSVGTRDPKAAALYATRLIALRRKLEVARRHAKLDTLEALAAADPKVAKDVAELAKFATDKLAFAEVEKRLQCEQLFDGKEKHATGQFDEPMREALIRFQQKHKLYDAAAMRPDTMAALAHTLLENDHAALVRVLTERVTAAADVVEDGSVPAGKNGPPTWTNEAGLSMPLRNMVDEALQATLSQLQLDTPERALAFFQRHPAEDFKSLRAAVRLPAPPEYYSPNMDLSVEIDRGDVIYDPLFDENGKPTNQTRHHFPSLTLRVRYRGQLIPLVHWRTTIGGWRSDLASNGYEYYRYKGSDVGPRVWRNVVSGPVWIAPNSTPVRTLVKPKAVHGARQLVVNYDEVGPGYLSAYGLVAAYNVVPGKNGKPDWDNGVRVHGSSEILSIRNPEAYSHGCHRLMNHLAVRLFSFVLQHRNVIIEGDKPLDFARQFLWKEDVYEMRLPSRGYWYRLDPPVPVNVLEGNIVGTTKKPITAYVPKPGIVYPPGPLPIPPDTPESRAGGGE